ncbi:MAG: acyl-CoA thioesterase [Ignavibacteriales bacterium]|nr:acyl-CoA thioesterase [Ignavibacteriales bacterium]
MNQKQFKHTTQICVRNYEVDWQGIVHNAHYLQYFEVGRIEYLKALGARLDLNTINGESRVVLVRNEIDYKAPAHFDDVINISTRVSFIKNTSFAMEGIMEKDRTKELVATNIAFHVWLDPREHASVPVPDEFRRMVQRFEGADCEIFWPTYKV